MKKDPLLLQKLQGRHGLGADEQNGLDAIRAWKTAAAAKYSYTSAPFAVEHKGGRYVVTSRLTGNFPGSPLDLRFAFRLERVKIASLEIGP